MHLPALTQFLTGLTENNNRPWFARNKPAYDILREEFLVLIADTARRVGKFDPVIGNIDPKKAMFRIYRDVRFSKNPDPYKTHFSAVIGERKGIGSTPGYYFQIDARGVLALGGGIYGPDPTTLKKIRAAIADQADVFNKALKDKRFATLYKTLSAEERLSRPPKGYAADHPMIEHIKNRHFFGFTEIDLNQHPSEDLAATIAEHFRGVYPLIQWLRGALVEA